MTSKKLKYQEQLSIYPNCPPANYSEIERDAFRWVHASENENDFKPVNLINDPPQRILDDTDKMCMGYGLSIFDSFENAFEKYKKQYTNRRSHLRLGFILDFGECIATLQVTYSDGIAAEPSKTNFGHFTFHEYENVNLRDKVKSLFNIFDPNGRFIN